VQACGAMAGYPALLPLGGSCCPLSPPEEGVNERTTLVSCPRHHPNVSSGTRIGGGGGGRQVEHESGDGKVVVGRSQVGGQQGRKRPGWGVGPVPQVPPPT